VDHIEQGLSDESFIRMYERFSCRRLPLHRISRRRPWAFRPPRNRDSGAGIHARRLTETLSGHEKDIPHKNVSRVKEFQAFYGEMKKRAALLAADAGAGNLQKTSLSYGRVLEVCASCQPLRISRAVELLVMGFNNFPCPC
jgi:hypothetical protein